MLQVCFSNIGFTRLEKCACRYFMLLPDVLSIGIFPSLLNNLKHHLKSSTSIILDKQVICVQSILEYHIVHPRIIFLAKFFLRDPLITVWHAWTHYKMTNNRWEISRRSKHNYDMEHIYNLPNDTMLFRSSKIKMFVQWQPWINYFRFLPRLQEDISICFIGT